MPTITISKETHAHLVAFQPVVRAFVKDEMSIDESADMLIRSAIEMSLNSLWQNLDVPTLVQSLQQVARRCPKDVYDFVAEMLAEGGEAREEQARRIGFHAPQKREKEEE